MLEKLAEWITRHPKTVVLIAVLLIIPSVLGFVGTKVNYDILSYLPQELNSVQGEEALNEVFHQASSAMMVIDNMDSKDILKIKGKIEKINGVSKVLWVDDIADISIPQDILPEFLTDIFYSKDGKSTLVIINFTEDSASDVTADAIHAIRKVMNSQCFLSGMSAIAVDTKAMSDAQTPIFVAIAIALALVVMSFTMESWVLPFVLLVALGFAVIYNMGTNILLGQISYITQSIAAILQLGVTMDYSVFLIDRFDEEKRKTDNRREAMAKAVKGTFLSLAGSSLTTIFGFLAMCFMSMTLGLDIGLVMAKGVLLGIITVVFVLPALVLLLYKPIYRFHHKKMVPSFKKINDFTIKHRKAVLLLFLALIIPAYIAESNLEVYYNMTHALPQDLPSISALNKMKDGFGMATTDFILTNTDVPSGKISRMVDEIEAVDGINNVISVNGYVGAGISEDILPDSIKESFEKGNLRMMMINSSYACATEESNRQVEELRTIMMKYDPNGYLTGEGVLTKDLVDVTDRDFRVTSTISIIAIFILVALCFKSISIPVILVSMIEFAIMVNKGLSFCTGSVVPFIAPIVIGCVQLGATVDYAILLTTRFREELRRGIDKLTALKDAANASSISIFQSSLVFFSATFGVYLLCDISMVKVICLMLARGALISAIVIMFVLPPVLYLTEGLINKTTHGWRKSKLIVKNKNNRAADKTLIDETVEKERVQNV